MIINLTQHPATLDQIAAGVIDLPALLATRVRELLTFNSLPTQAEIQERAECLAHLAGRADLDLPVSDSQAGVPFRSAMIGGAPYLMSALESALRDACIQPVYAFSVRASTEEVQLDGTVRKINIFRHAGFVSA